MSRLTAILGLLAAATAALVLFAVKQEVRQMEDDLRAAHRDIRDQQEAIHVLETEWSYLNQPARIAALASEHLGLQPISAERIVRLDDLPFRPAQAEPAAERTEPKIGAGSSLSLPATAQPAKIVESPPATQARSLP